MIIHAAGGSFRLVTCTISSGTLFQGQHRPRIETIEQKILIEPEVRSAVVSSNGFSGRLVVNNKAAGKIVVENNVDQTG